MPLKYRSFERATITLNAINFFTTLLLVTGPTLTSGDGGHHWGYNDEDAWSGTCEGGREQSPVNLQRQGAETCSLPAVELHRYDKSLDMEVLNNGHTLAARLPGAVERPEISGAGLPYTYLLDSLHIHWGGSEHTFSSTRYPLELHLVHYAAIFKNLSHALNSGDRQALAVVAVVYDTVSECDGKACLDAESDPTGLWTSWRKVLKEGPKSTDRLQLKPDTLVPEDLTGWWRYEGSLTTPGCNEQVIWTVLSQRGHITKKTVNELTAFPGLPRNYRRLQPLQGRQILFRPSEHSSATISNMISLPLLVLSVFIGVKSY